MKCRIWVACLGLIAMHLNSNVQAQVTGQAVPTPASQPALAPVPPAPAPVVAKSWIVMDYDSGMVLAGDNIHVHLPPASMTKVMTSYVIAAEMRHGKLRPDEPVMMTENAWHNGGAGTDGSFSGFPVNKTAPLVAMERGMVVQSGNDAAIALAEHVAGSEPAFASLMNQYAKRLGLEDTHFVDATGLAAKGHYSSAYDMAQIGRALIHDFPTNYAYNKIKELTVNGIRQPNRNLLLWRDQTVDGIKTGHTSEAGYCIMNSAVHGEQRLITVVMGARSERQRADASLALLNWGFRFFETHRLYEPGQAVVNQPIWKAQGDTVSLEVSQPLFVTVHRGRYHDLKPSIEVPRFLQAPIASGQRVGWLKVRLDGTVVAQAPLIAAQRVETAGLMKRLWHSAWLWWRSS